MNPGIAAQIMAHYTQLDGVMEAFQSDLPLHCPTGCGACCENPTLETTPLEMLPLVLELFHRGTAEAWLSLAQASDFEDICVFYQPDPQIAGNGRCQVYPWRPTVCRLFGYATITHKSGEPQLAACARHKALMPEVVAQVEGAIAAGSVELPNFAAATQQITNLDPEWGTRRFPINAALKMAIERVGLYQQMQTHMTPTEAPSDLPQRASKD